MLDLAHTWADPGRHLSCARCGARVEFRRPGSVRALIARLLAWEQAHTACGPRKPPDAGSTPGAEHTPSTDAPAGAAGPC